MPRGILRPISAALARRLPEPPEFTDLVAATLGDELTEADGVDRALDTMFTTFPEPEAVTAGVDKILDDAATANAELNTVTEDQVAQALAETLEGGDKALADLEGVLAETKPKQPPAATPPAGGGTIRIYEPGIPPLAEF